MKSLKTLLTCGMLLASVVAFGQSTTTKPNAHIKRFDNYSRIFTGYNPLMLKKTIDDDESAHGWSMGYIHGFNIVESQPLYLELGGEFVFNFKKLNEPTITKDFKLTHTVATYRGYSLIVPVNVTYKIPFGRSNVSLSPFTGFTFKGNLKAKEYIDNKSYDFFDKDLMGKDYKWKRFQAGWQVGANLDIDAFYIGLHYGLDFYKISKGIHTSNWGISIGAQLPPPHLPQPSQLRDSDPKSPKDGNYSRIQVGYNPMMVYDIDDTCLHGASFSYLRGIKLNPSRPLFLEVGGRIAYNMKKETEDVNVEDKVFHMDVTDKVMTLSVPVNLTYRIPLGNSKVSLSPFVGITFKANLLAEETVSFKNEKETLNLFDKDDVGEDSQWKRFQVGWQTGFNLDTNSPFSIGFHYGRDFKNICKKTKTSNWNVTLGWTF